jgi:3-hydroxyisobutyrate dehydrogenase-like beta-hydroxyacid dehydrogenase
MTTLGFIGTGGMGSGMAANLIRAGYSLVVTDLNRDQCKGLEEQGAQYADSPKAVAESCELVLSMLPNNDAVRAVGLGAGGLAEASGGAKEWIDFSSIDKATIVDVAGELGGKGWTVIDAGAGGVEEVAAAGNLVLWISGSTEMLEKHRPVLEPMSKLILQVGELGNAKLVKTGMAMLAAVQHMTLAEIAGWFSKGGLDNETFQTILKNSAWDSSASSRVMEIMVSGEYKPRKSWMPKDVSFGLDIAREMEVPTPFVSLAYQMFAIAQATGEDGYEATGIACNVYDTLNGVKS